MTPAHWQFLLIYGGAMLAATFLAVVGRAVRPEIKSRSLARKYPSYILMNMAFFAAAWLGPRAHSLTALLALLGGLAAWEIVRAVLPGHNGESAPDPTAEAVRHLPPEGAWKWLPVGATVILIAAADWLDPSAWLILWLSLLLVLIPTLAWGGASSVFPRRGAALLGSAVYVAASLASYVWTWRADPSGFTAAFLYLIIASNDAMAQIVGELLGSRPLAPRISPAKTVEGALGGLISAAVVGALAGRVLGWNMWIGLGVGALTAVTGLIGDLTASSWKRALGLRDFGALLGAHGGIMDRFDGLIFAAPAFFILTSLL